MKIYFYLIVILITLAGCAPSINLQEVTATSQYVSPPNQATTLDSTETRVATNTSPPTSTSIPHKPINTPFQSEKEKISLELLQTNNGCDLPCWWGVFPNETRWSDAEAFLKPFSEIYERQPPNEWDVYDVRSPLTIKFSDIHAVGAVFAVQEGIVKEIEIEGFDEETYHLSSFLQKHGAPTEILVSSYSSDYGLPKNQVPLSINLYYPEKGINALYGTYATVNGEQIYGCLQKSPILFLWSPSEHLRSVDYILRWDENHTQYLNVEQALGMSIQEFYEKHVNSTNQPCLLTPKNLWQSQ